jgi:phosphoglycerate kinase
MIKTLEDFNFKDQKVLIRVDFNVPLDENGTVTDATRIARAKPTILKVLEDGGAVILMSHLGRPKGVDTKYSLKQTLETISEIIGVLPQFASDCVGEEATEKAASFAMGEILLLENLRFHPEEKAGNVDFAQKLAKLGDFYINDAFGTAHRAHASTTVIAQFFEGKKAAGYLLANEIKAVTQVLEQGKKPILAILGGAKISSKIGVVKNLIDRVDNIIIGGGMAYTFIKAQGGKIGDSICEDDQLDLALEILAEAKAKNTKIYLPVDTVIASSFSNDVPTKVVAIDNIPDGWMGLDIGPKTQVGFSYVALANQTILWNGPMGVFEMTHFRNGTRELGNAIADATANGAYSLVGGGDSVAAVALFGLANEVSYISTGGGALLEMLEGKILPGIAALEV